MAYIFHALPSEASTAGDLARQFLDALGPAYQAPDGSNNAADALAYGGALAGARTALTTALAQAFVGEATVLLTELEQEYGLPVRVDLTTAQRQARLLAKVRAARGSQPQRMLRALTAIAPEATLAENTPSTVPHELDTAFAPGAARGVYQFGVLVSATTFADPVALPALKAVVEQMKPAHTRGSIGTRRHFRCADPLSLTNRDLLG
jgi:uncharacterized protein YmfQ (DUF2313 family)